MKCQICQFDLVSVITTDEGKQYTLCPNHEITAMLLNRVPLPEPQTVNAEDLICEVTGETKGIWKMVEVRASFGAPDEVWTLRSDIMLRLIARNLTPTEWKVLTATHGEHAFLLHDDFYGDEGQAWQPIVVDKE